MQIHIRLQGSLVANIDQTFISFYKHIVIEFDLAFKIETE